MTAAGQRLADRIDTFRVVGSSPAHHDFAEKVSGTLHYAADWRLPGMLFARVVRSQLPSASIRSVDVTKARALPGVACVLTAADVPSNAIVERASGGLGELEVTMPVLADGRVRYLGEPVALVAAATRWRRGPTERRWYTMSGTPWSAGRSGAATRARRWRPPTWWLTASTAASTSSTPTSSRRPASAGSRTAC
jgi:hypothetical protein